MLPFCSAMASPLFPALAAGALLALLTQIPPSLNAAQRLLPVVWRPGQPEGLGSLSHRAPRHAAPRVLQPSHADRQASAFPLRPPGKAPRRPWGLSSPAQAGGHSPPPQNRPAPSAHR